MPLLTKSKYLAGLQCPKLLWYLVKNKHAIPQPSKDALHKMNVGTQVGILATKLFPEGINIPTENFEINLQLTKDSLKQRKPLFEAGILKNDCFARIDILQPDNNAYNIIEVKSGTKVKEEHIEDVAFQKHCLKLNNIKVNKCFLCHINNEYIKQGEINIQELFKIQDITQEVNEIKDIQEKIDNFFTILSNKEPTTPIGNHCKSPYECNLKTLCWSNLPKHNVFTLCRGGAKSQKLFDNNIQEIKDIPDDFKLTNNQAIQKACAISNKPHIQIKEIKQFLDTLHYPLYHLDFETFAPAIPLYNKTKPYQRIPFQFSLHIEQEDGTIEHISFLAQSNEDPRKAFLAKLKEVLGNEGSVVVYNQAFEKGVLKELARDFPAYDAWVNDVLPRVVDLLIPFRNFHYYNPCQKGSASIKKVLPALTDLSYEGMEIADGSNASLSFEEMVHGKIDDGSRKALEKYCELDTWAEVVLVRSLKTIIHQKTL